MVATLERLDMEELAALHGTPIYIYDLRKLRGRIATLRSIFDVPRFELLFATMANDHPEILRAIASEAVGACVNSLPHLNLALEAGFSASLTQFTSTGITLADMLALHARKTAVNLDSPNQITQWCALARGKTAGARINAGSLLGAGPERGDRIGMDVEDLPRAIQEASSYEGAIRGLHIYAGTNFQTADAILPILRAFFRLAESVPSLEYVNIGGGIGVDYSHCGSEFDLLGFGAEISSMVRRLCNRFGRHIDLFFEPGRGLVASAAQFLTRVTDVKLLNGITYVAVDASVAIFPRPLHHPDSPHRVTKVGQADGDSFQQVTIVGRTTFSRDILARCALPGEARIGDLLVFDDAGAYCQSMSSRFLGQDLPNCLILEG